MTHTRACTRAPTHAKIATIIASAVVWMCSSVQKHGPSYQLTADLGERERRFSPCAFKMRAAKNTDSPASPTAFITPHPPTPVLCCCISPQRIQEDATYLFRPLFQSSLAGAIFKSLYLFIHLGLQLELCLTQSLPHRNSRPTEGRFSPLLTASPENIMRNTVPCSSCSFV